MEVGGGVEVSGMRCVKTSSIYKWLAVLVMWRCGLLYGDSVSMLSSLFPSLRGVRGKFPWSSKEARGILLYPRPTSLFPGSTMHAPI